MPFGCNCSTRDLQLGTFLYWRPVSRGVRGAAAHFNPRIRSTMGRPFSKIWHHRGKTHYLHHHVSGQPLAYWPWKNKYSVHVRPDARVLAYTFDLRDRVWAEPLSFWSLRRVTSKRSVFNNHELPQPTFFCYGKLRCVIQLLRHTWKPDKL